MGTEWLELQYYIKGFLINAENVIKIQVHIIICGGLANT